MGTGCRIVEDDVVEVIQHRVGQLWNGKHMYSELLGWFKTKDSSVYHWILFLFTTVELKLFSLIIFYSALLAVLVRRWVGTDLIGWTIWGFTKEGSSRS